MKHSLDDMALFVDVVKANGFRHAADITGIPSSTISRRITTLEKLTGLRLLHRTTRKIELTEAGRLYYERSRHIVDEARLAHEELNDIATQPSGVLRVSLPVDFAIFYLAPLITEFAALYPAIAFEFDITPQKVDLISDAFDVAIRMGEIEDSLLIARKLMALTMRLYASPDYLARFGTPQSPHELEQHQCLGTLKKTNWTLFRGDEKQTVTINSRYKLNNVGMMRRLATLGQGIILMPEGIMREEVANNNFKQILPQWQGAPQPIWLLTETLLLPAKTQKFIDFLKEKLAQ